jgi:glucokinase
MSIVLSADIGGSHITAGLIDLENKKVLGGSLKRTAVDARGSSDEILGKWSQLLGEILHLSPVKVTSLGLAVPGPMDYGNGISLIESQDKFRSLYGKNIKAELSSVLGIEVSGIQMENDALCFLKGELWYAGHPGTRTLGITLGSGLGSAFFNGREVNDANLWNRSFKSGSVEDYLSTTWFIRRFMEETGIRCAGVKEILEVKNQKAENVIFNEYGDNLNEFIKDVTDEFNIDQVVIGGNIALAHKLFTHRFSDVLKYRISSLGELAALYGAVA